MALLNTRNYQEELSAVVATASSTLDIAVAFITCAGISSLLDSVGAGVQVRVVARWRLADLLSGASDLLTYPVLLQLGIPLYVHPELHAKVILSDQQAIFIGSANLTRRGLGLAGTSGNLELGVRTTACATDLVEIEAIFASSVRVTPDLFEEISACVEAARVAPEIPDYPARVRVLLRPNVEGLWVRDLFWTATPIEGLQADDDFVHDMQLVGLSPEDLTSPSGARRFCEMDSVAWLIQRLRKNDGELYFGQLATLLHEALLEDPKPYRKDVKTLLSNLLAWCSHVLPETILVDAPNYSQRVRLGGESKSATRQKLWLEKVLQLRQDHDPRTWSDATLFASPHKPLFILAVLEAMSGESPKRCDFKLTRELVEQFKFLWSNAFPGQPKGDPFLPFVHLASDGLWALSGQNGDQLTAMEARALSAEERPFVQARIHHDLMACVETEAFRLELANVVIRRFFDAETAALLGRALSRDS